MNREAAVAIMAELVKTADLLNEAFSETRIQTYLEALEGLDPEAVCRAFKQVRQTATFFPRPAEIRNIVLGDPADRAVLGWSRLLTAVRHHGPYASVDFQDPVLHTCIEAMGGWPTVASIESDPKTLGYRQHEFIQHYRAYQHRLPGRPRLHLPGILEIANTDRGMWDHALDHAGHVLVVSEDGREVVERRALGPATTTPALPAGEQEPPLTIERMRATVRELAEKFGTPEQIRREELLLTAARSRVAPPALTSDLGRAMDETLNEQAKESTHG